VPLSTKAGRSAGLRGSSARGPQAA
jgi:hypothetical protein